MYVTSPTTHAHNTKLNPSLNFLDDLTSLLTQLPSDFKHTTNLTTLQRHSLQEVAYLAAITIVFFLVRLCGEAS
jgi:hypothetical protein